VQTLPELFGGARADFNPGDPHFAEVYCRLDAPAARGAETRAGAAARARRARRGGRPRRRRR
jgi:hypothetical protein